MAWREHFAANSFTSESQSITSTTLLSSPPTRQYGIETSLNPGETPLQWLQARSIKATISHSTLNGHDRLRPINHPLPHLRRCPPHLDTHLTHSHRHINPHTTHLHTTTTNTNLGHPTPEPLHHPRGRNIALLPHPNPPRPAPLPEHTPPGPSAQRHTPPRRDLRRRRHAARLREHAPPHRSARLEPQDPAAERHGTSETGRQEESHAEGWWRGVWAQAAQF